MFGALQLGLGLTAPANRRVFNPSDLFQSGDILLWYDPSDLTTMFQDTTGVTPVTADGQSVAIVLDKGQWGGRTLAQVLAAQTPTISDSFDSYADVAALTAVWLNNAPTRGTVSLSAGTVRLTNDGTGTLYLERAITTVAGRRYRYIAPNTISAGSARARIQAGATAGTSGLGAVVATAVGTSSLQLDFTASGTTTYIAILAFGGSGSASHYAEFPEVEIREIPGYHREQATGTSMPKYKTDGTLHWLLYDGTDDSMQTSTIAWGTDEFVLCGGLYKASDAASGMYAELSASVSTTNGSAYLANSGGTPNWSINSRGTLVAAAVGSTGAAPNTAVLTGQAKISTDYLNLRGNGASIGSSSSDQGTGNYGSHVLNFGRRNNASLPINGREYQTVIRSRLLSAAELASLETFIAAKTGVIL